MYNIYIYIYIYIYICIIYIYIYIYTNTPSNKCQSVVRASTLVAPFVGLHQTPPGVEAERDLIGGADERRISGENVPRSGRSAATSKEESARLTVAAG